MASDTGTFDTLRSAIADRYALERELGRGGMATVFLARDLRHERQVALKVLHAELGAVLGAERFLTEIRTTANLQHPNILPLFDSGAAAGLVFYVMPYITGETLRSRLQREGQLSVAETIRLARGIGAALDYAHRQGVIHRDIKPENILLQDGQPLVADFGIALAVSNAGGTRITQTGLSVGTPAYMSPEQAAAERQLDGRSDQYSLASVLYEMLAGAPPFTGASAAAVMSKLMTEVPARIEAARASVPAGVGDALARALEKVPADRFDTVAQFIDALGADASGGYRSARVVPGAERVWKRRAMAFAGVGVVGVAAALVVPRWVGRNASSIGVDEPRFFSIVLPDSLPVSPAADMYGVPLRGIDISGDGKRIVYNTEGKSASRLAVADLTTGHVQVVPATDSALMPTFSPSGDELLFIRDVNTAETAIWRTSLQSASPSLFHRAPFLAQSLSWHRSGSVFTSTFWGCLYRADDAGGPMVQSDSTHCPVMIPPTTEQSGHLQPVDVGGAIGLYDVGRGTTRMVTIAGDTARPVRGINPMLIGGGLLVVIRDSSVLAARIDTVRAVVSAEPKVVLSGVAAEPLMRSALIALDRRGTLVWISGGSSERTALLRLAPGGRLIDTVAVSRDRITSIAMSRSGRFLAYSTGILGSANALVLHDLQSGVREVIQTAEDLEPYALLTDGFSPMIATGRKQESRIVTVTNGRLTVDRARPLPLSQSPDGTARCRGTLYWHTSTPGDSIQLAPAGRGHCRFSPDGQWLTFMKEDGLYVVPATSPTKDKVVRLSDRPDLDELKWTSDSRGIVTRAGDVWLRFRIDGSGHGTGAADVYAKGAYSQGQTTFALDGQDNLIVMTAAPTVRSNRLNVLTNFPKYVEERLKQ
jgi:serine/threonine-protein kinase